MRGLAGGAEGLFSYVRLAERVPAEHPLRAIRALTDATLATLDGRFEALYSRLGRPSIPPEHLLRATLLQALFSVRSERMLMEQIDNLLFRWFVGLLSTSTETGPPIGVEEGPPPEGGGTRLTRWSLSVAQAGQARFSGRGGSGQARFLKRQLSLPVSTMSQWWVSRSRSAVVILASPKTLGHSPKARLVVTITEVRS